MQHTSNEKTSEALKLLAEAAAQKKDDLKSALSDKYAHLKDVIVETEGRLVKSLSDASKNVVEAVVHTKDAGVEKARKLARDVDQHVHRNPWATLAGTAAVGLLLGYILGRKRK